MHYTKQPDIRPIGESGNLYILMHDYEGRIGGVPYTIPKGFEYDGASYAALLFQRDGIHRAACLEHDYLYVNKGIIPEAYYTRLNADNRFRDMLLEAGVKSWHVKLAYAAVRLAGGLYWRRKAA